MSLSELTLTRDVISHRPVDVDCVNSHSVDILYERSHRDKPRRHNMDKSRLNDFSRQSRYNDFSLSESLSTIPVEVPETPRNVTEVYRELHSINQKLRVSIDLCISYNVCLTTSRKRLLGFEMAHSCLQLLFFLLHILNSAVATYSCICIHCTWF